MNAVEKSERFKKLFLIKEFGDFLNFKRNAMDFMDAPSAYALLLQSLSSKDILDLEKENVRFGLIVAPASQITMQLKEDWINLLCFEKHFFLPFTKEETVAIILHELGHVFNPGLDGDYHEFAADDYAIERNYGAAIKSSLVKAIDLKLPGFIQDINYKRIERIHKNG